MNLPFKSPLTEDGIANLWKMVKNPLTPEERRGMTIFVSALILSTKKEPVVFHCPDGTLLKIEVYDPKPIDPFSSEHAQKMMSDKFVIAAINQAFENGIKSARNRI